MQICVLNAFADNYIWMIIKNNNLIVIDPGVSNSVLSYIAQYNLRLQAVILTHDHWDHIGGVEDILTQYPVPVYGSGALATFRVKEFDVIDFEFGISLKVISTPGHTFDGLSYLVEDEGGKAHLFCGDTLFGAGCGRVFTNDYSLMYASLVKIKHLDPTTKLYPAHEYTLQNLHFAKYVEPNNPKIDARLLNDEKNLHDNGMTLPSTLSLELDTNPFLRCNVPSLIQSVTSFSGCGTLTEFECFTYLRQLKDDFTA